MLEFKGKCVIGIDLAGSSRNPSGWALLKGEAVKAFLLYTDSEILENIVRSPPRAHSHRRPFEPSKKGRTF
jgi:hypothetical protein